ncbi:hypothetical protein H0I76_14930 [Limibaculum sp. M0105]|uniref:Secreted protein n=1 Tax=Thermohalobaculum xanthum TaxID=2753746 RepID=A0A8J7M995_9RHOB|nr:hypothetical protein [Thermohalobaculum xanthum]MBK0400493.1 hypothetical protein [Thermohalobaculum xanthum]
MTATLRIAAILAALALPAQAEEDFSAGSTASSWGLTGERLARFDARVVDAVCALTGDCPADCGAGLRQMVLIREADGVMVLAMKNTQPIFTGATVDLARWCGQTVTVDGLLVGEPEQTQGGRLMQVQTVTAPGAEAAKTDQWLDEWRAANPDAGTGDWFRHDPRIRERIARDGYLGLGLETDAAFISENQ